MSLAGSESQDPAVTCTDLLEYDEEALVCYLKKQDRGGEFDISSLNGVELLSGGQRNDLMERLSKAALRLPIGIDDLHDRLQNVANGGHGRSSDLEPPESPSESVASSLPPITVQDLEVSSRQELARARGRPVCSTEELAHILAAPMERHQAILSWLSDSPDTETGAGELRTVFSRQFSRWWDFRRSQWDNRGLAGSEAGISAFLEASRRRYEGSGATAMVSDPSFDETIRRQWQHIPASRRQPPPDGQTYAAYINAVKTRLAPYRFSPLPQLKKDPHKQTAWTEWLEYLSFELRCLEILTAAAESLEPEYHQSLRRLLKERQPNRNTAQVGKCGPTGRAGINMAKELAAVRADRDASQRSIDNFIRETEAYTRARREALHQRYRVEWVTKEARLMETEMSLQRSSARSKKRKQRDEEPDEQLPLPQPKRTRQRDGSSINAGAITPPRPQRRDTQPGTRRT